MEVRRLDREGRVNELAKMIGGDLGDASGGRDGSATATRASARELLDRAESWRTGAAAPV